MFIRPMTRFRRICAVKFEEFHDSVDRYSQYLKDSKNCFWLLVLSSVIYGAVILLEILS